ADGGGAAAGVQRSTLNASARRVLGLFESADKSAHSPTTPTLRRGPSNDREPRRSSQRVGGQDAKRLSNIARASWSSAATCRRFSTSSSTREGHEANAFLFSRNAPRAGGTPALPPLAYPRCYD